MYIDIFIYVYKLALDNINKQILFIGLSSAS